MASKKISIHEEHILKLILEFLSSRKYYKSARSLEKDTGVTSNPYSENINFFRELVLDGDWEAVREFGEPLADIPAFEYRKFNFLVAKQEYLELLFEKCHQNSIYDGQILRDRLLTCLQNLERYCTFKEQYNKLYWYLSVPSLYSEPEFCNWNVDSSRLQLFEEMLELLKQFLPIREQNIANRNIVSEDRLLALLFKGLLYENCIEFCQKQAIGKMMSDSPLTDIRVDFFRKQSLKSTGNFYSWLHSLSRESFAEPFEELNFDLQLEKRKRNRVNAEVKNNSLSRSLTIELKSPAKLLSQKGRDERRKRLSDFPASKPSVLDFDMHDVSQSFAEFEFAKNGNDRFGVTGYQNNHKPSSNEQEVFLPNGDISPDAPVAYVSHVLPNKVAQSPRKSRHDQENSVLQQLEEHKQRQQELYEQLAETASLAKLNHQVKDDTIPDDSARSLEAVKKSIQSLRLLAESYESPKPTQTDVKDDVFIPNRDSTAKLSTESQKDCEGSRPRPNTISTTDEKMKNSSSSTPGSAALPKTPVNTCLPPGLVKLTDGSGTFNTSTPKAERQSFTTPLPASPVTSEQKSARNDVPLRQLQHQHGISTKEDDTRPNTVPSDQTPRIPDAKQLPVRRSLVNTVFQNEEEKTDAKYKARTTIPNNTPIHDDTGFLRPSNTDAPVNTNENENYFAKERSESNPMNLKKQTSIPFSKENDMKDARFVANSGLKNTQRKTGSDASVETNSLSTRLANFSTSNDPKVTVGGNRSLRTDDPKDHRSFRDILNLKNTNNCIPARIEKNPPNSRFPNYSTPNSPQKTTDAANSPRKMPTRVKDSKFQDVSTLTKPPTTMNTQAVPTPVQYNYEGMSPSSLYNAPLHFQKSAMLTDTQAIRAVAFHPSGNVFAVGTNSKALKICRKNESPHFERDEETQLEVLCQKTSIHKGSVYCIAFSSSGEIIATGSNDKTIKLSRFNEDAPVNLESQMELSIHSATVRDLTFVNTAAGGNPVLASGGAGGGLVHLSDCCTGQTLTSLQGHAGNVMAVFASDQADLLCSGSADRTVRLWDLRTAKCVDVIPSSGCVTSVCFNYGPTHSLLLASADDSGQCILYDVGARKCITSFTPHEMDCRSIRFSPDSQHILTGSYDACVAITAVQYRNSEILSESQVVGKHADKIIQCRWHPSEYSFVSTSADKTVALWQETTR